MPSHKTQIEDTDIMFKRYATIYVIYKDGR
jgi:hypothetical protein